MYVICFLLYRALQLRVCLEKRKLETFKHWTSELDTHLSFCQCRQGLTSQFLGSVLSLTSKHPQIYLTHCLIFINGENVKIFDKQNEKRVFLKLHYMCIDSVSCHRATISNPKYRLF